MPSGRARHKPSKQPAAERHCRLKSDNASSHPFPKRPKEARGAADNIERGPRDGANYIRLLARFRPEGSNSDLIHEVLA